MHHSSASALTSDVVFRMVRFIHPTCTVRFHEGQLLAVLNSETERDECRLHQLRKADVKIDHHPAEMMLSEVCGLPVQTWHTSPPVDATEREIAMFTSNYAAKWRVEYFEKLTKAVHIDLYGKCLHN